MMGIPIKTDLEEQGQETNLRINAGEQKSMHSTMIALWVKSIEFAIITWRTRGYRRHSKLVRPRGNHGGYGKRSL
jgi:hypothetical protein